MAEKYPYPDDDLVPPSLFLGDQEKDFAKHINTEVMEHIINQLIFYHAVDYDRTNFHDVYGEALEKVFLPPVKINVLVAWNGYETKTSSFGVDRLPKITVHFHARRLTEDQELYVREGDYIQYGRDFYEIVTLNEPLQLYGSHDKQVEIAAECVKLRKNMV